MKVDELREEMLEALNEAICKCSQQCETSFSEILILKEENKALREELKVIHEELENMREKMMLLKALAHDGGASSQFFKDEGKESNHTRKRRLKNVYKEKALKGTRDDKEEREQVTQQQI
ncbi:hypothetical protein V6N11_055532 [Hibiscus sabdariffa]|uniref:Uncharacterized protein n=1 Tax=Hibiscus sabdariffa TaxID=183260 RepID=A0ABR2NR40_9ROSI